MARQQRVSPAPRTPGSRATQQTRLAMDLHRAGKLDEARVMYRKVLAYAPNHADAWHFHGMLLLQTGDARGAIRDVRRALDLAPGYVDALANLAIIHLDQREFADCERCLTRVLSLRPTAVPPRITLGRLYRALGRLDESEAVLRDALDRDLSIDGRELESALHGVLANTLLAQGRSEEALSHYRRALEINPGVREIHVSLGHALCRLKRFDEAAAQYRAILEHDPGDVRARHLLAACGGASTPDRAEDDYVRTVFDDFSTSFDQKLASLGYRAPELLLRAMQESLGDACHDLDLLDAGCGTGLFGERARPFCSGLIGVDLSPGMLQIARGRNLYDQLHEAELASWLAAQSAAFDVVASADTLCYFGALDGALRAAYSALRPGGWLFFSVEHHRGEASADFHLQHHGRYAHAESYVDRMLADAGFGSVRIIRDVLRTEAGSPVPGLVVSGRRIPS
ncbi:MAG: tetratricopeptide repeat protein [Panacagrimonas sp.]